MMAELTKDQWIKEQLSAKNLQDNKTNRDKLSKQYDAIYVGGDTKDWRTYFKRQFPQLANMFDSAAGEQEARSIFGDLIDLFIDVAQNPDNYDFATEAGRSAFKTKVEGTQYAQKTSSRRAEWDALKDADKKERLSQKVGELKGTFAGMGLTMTEMNNLALTALKNGANDLELKYLAFSKLLDRPEGGIMETKEAMDLKQTLRAYDYSFTDEDINNALTNTEKNGVPQTAELLINKARFGAKLKYSGFSDLFDQGYTVSDVFEPYQQMAARLLERSPADISLKSDLYRRAIETRKEDGTPLTMSDWSRIIKTDDKYGWQYTNQAHQQIDGVVSSLEKMFGLRQ